MTLSSEDLDRIEREAEIAGPLLGEYYWPRDILALVAEVKEHRARIARRFAVPDPASLPKCPRCAAPTSVIVSHPMTGAQYECPNGHGFPVPVGELPSVRAAGKEQDHG